MKVKVLTNLYLDLLNTMVEVHRDHIISLCGTMARGYSEAYSEALRQFDSMTIKTSTLECYAICMRAKLAGNHFAAWSESTPYDFSKEGDMDVLRDRAREMDFKLETALKNLECELLGEKA